MRFLAVCLSAVVALTSVAGCAVATQSDSDSLGQLSVPRVSTSGDGTLFRLSAQFIITDVATNISQIVDGGGDAPSLQVPLSPGSYRVTLADGFFLERSVAGGPLLPVAAVLASAQTVNITIQQGISTFVSFQFLIANDTPAQGFLTISFGVAPQTGQLFGTLLFDVATGALAPYAQASPPSFIAPYQITAEGGFSFPPRHEFHTGTVGFVVLSDDVGPLTVLAPGMAGGILDFAIETRPDDTQRFTLGFTSQTSVPFAQLILQTDDLQPRVPVNEGRIPNDPVQSSFRALIPFQLVFIDGNNFAAGRIDLQFLR